MPFMKFNWATHDTWCSRMTFEERGCFDAVRAVLWSVVGCKMSLEMLRKRLGIKAGTKTDKLLLGLIERGSLSFLDGKVFDEVQVNEFSQAVAKAEVNKSNGIKGGRPKVPQEPLQRETAAEQPVPEANPADF